MPATLPQKIIRILSFIFLLFILQAVLLSAPLQAATATVKVGQVYNATVGSTVDVIVSVQNPTGMAGFQFELTFNPSIATYKSIAKGSSLPGSEPIVNTNNAATGSIRVAWMDLSPVNNNVDLCRITFNVVSAGSTTLELKNLELVGLSGAIASQSENGLITSQQGTTPPPGQQPNPNPNPNPAPQPLPFAITSSQTLPHAHLGSSYSFTLAAVRGTLPYTWELKSGKLPEGLELNTTTGNIAGTPAKSGQHEFTIKVTDKDNKTAERKFALSVSDGSAQPIDLPAYDYSRFNTTDTVTFKDLTLSQGGMEVKLTPGKMPYTMVVDRNTREIDLLVSLYAADHKVYVNNVLRNAPGANRVALQNGSNNITLRITSGDKASRLYNISVFRLP